MQPSMNNYCDATHTLEPVTLQTGRQEWQLYRQFKYRWLHNDVLHRMKIPAGFEYDGASVPRICWPLISPWSLRAGALVHDWIYRHGGDIPNWSHQRQTVENETVVWKNVTESWTRHDADRIMCRIARERDVPMWQRRTAFWAVRLCGGWSWNG